jgi:hypothetical protein
VQTVPVTDKVFVGLILLALALVQADALDVVALDVHRIVLNVEANMGAEGLPEQLSAHQRH